MSFELADPIRIPYEKLISDADLSHEIETAFGYSGLGLLLVTGIPDFSAHREKLLPLATKFANLPEDKKKTMEHSASNYSVGWSHGKEKLKKGQFGMYSYTLSLSHAHFYQKAARKRS
jgi:isopenicillin N synthase-like dioxygenase